MLWLAAGSLLLLVAGILLVRRARRRGREAVAEAARELESFLAARDLTFQVVDRGLGGLELRDPASGRSQEVPRRLLRGRGKARERLFGAAAAVLRAGLHPLPGELDLKRHGPGLVPRLVAPELVALLGKGDGIAATPMEELGVVALPVLSPEGGGEGLPYLTHEHLHKAGIDARDVHGVSLAVLRQRLEVERLRSLLEEGGGRLETGDGLAASRVLLLPDLLEDGDRPARAWVPEPSVLLLAPDDAPSPQARDGGPPLEPLLDRALTVDATGLSLAPE